MKIIKGISRQQVQFSSLDELIAPDNRVRILDAFVEKPDPKAIGLKKPGSEQTRGNKEKTKTNPGVSPRVDGSLFDRLLFSGFSAT
jgi:hypothetical protein